MAEIPEVLTVGPSLVVVSTEVPDVTRLVAGGGVVSRVDASAGPIPFTLPYPSRKPKWRGLSGHQTRNVTHL